MLYKTARKLVVAVIGSTVVLIGLIGWLLPVVPGFVLGPVGLAILATEFVWARHVLGKVKQSASDVAGWFTGRSKRPIRPDGPPPAGPSSSSSSSTDKSDAAVG